MNIQCLKGTAKCIKSQQRGGHKMNTTVFNKTVLMIVLAVCFIFILGSFAIAEQKKKSVKQVEPKKTKEDKGSKYYAKTKIQVVMDNWIGEGK